MDTSADNFPITSREQWIENKVKNQVTFEDMYSIYILTSHQKHIMNFNQFKTKLNKFLIYGPIRQRVIAHTSNFLDEYHQIIELLLQDGRVIGVW